MKKITILIAFTIGTLFSNATIINVDNNPNRPSGYFADLQLAINASTAGDTIYLYPSNSSYGNITISKQLHVFGKGYSGSSSGFNSRIEHLYLDTATSPASNPSGSSFQGLTISYLTCSKPNITNILLIGNYLANVTQCLNLNNNCSGWLIANNYFSGYITIDNNASIVINNNIFGGYYGYPINQSSSSSVIFSHNLVMYFQYFNTVTNAIVTDNIFVCSGATNTSYMYNNVFYNNISWRSTLNPYVMPPEANTGSGNISNQDPQFQTAPSSDSFDQAKDYHLKSTSPGKNAATDGTDIGPYGGSNPFVWGGQFSIPKIAQSNITNPVINQSTPINVNVKATKAAY